MGPCYGATPLCFCTFDVDLSGGVNVNDLLVQFTNWGPCQSILDRHSPRARP